MISHYLHEKWTLIEFCRDKFIRGSLATWIPHKSLRFWFVKESYKELKNNVQIN